MSAVESFSDLIPVVPAAEAFIPNNVVYLQDVWDKDRILQMCPWVSDNPSAVQTMLDDYRYRQDLYSQLTGKSSLEVEL